MIALLMIIVYLVLGMGLQQLPLNAPQLATLMSRYVLWIALPAVTLQHISHLPLQTQLWVPASVAWVVFAAAGIWVYLLQRRLGWGRATTGCLLLTCGLANTSFVGFPLIQWLYGEKGLQTAIVIDQTGTFLVLSTLGLLAAGFYSGQTASVQSLLKRLFTFPPFIAFGIALTLNFTHTHLGESLRNALQALGATLTPAALLAVGLQLQWRSLQSYRTPLVTGLIFRLGLSPLLIWMLYRGGFGITGDVLAVGVLEAGMAPMITAAIVASNMGLNPPLAGLMVSLGIPLSLLTIPLWNALLTYGG